MPFPGICSIFYIGRYSVFCFLKSCMLLGNHDFMIFGGSSYWQSNKLVTACPVSLTTVEIEHYALEQLLSVIQHWKIIVDFQRIYNSSTGFYTYLILISGNSVVFVFLKCWLGGNNHTEGNHQSRIMSCFGGKVLIHCLWAVGETWLGKQRQKSQSQVVSQCPVLTLHKASMLVKARLNQISTLVHCSNAQRSEHLFKLWTDV